MSVMLKAFLKIRLSYYYLFFLTLFVVVVFSLQKHKFDGAQLTLFSVNSFLYGFYLAPILNAQKMRIEELTRIIRNEAIALFGVRIKSRDLADKERETFKKLETAYIVSLIANQGSKISEKKYEALMAYCLDYKGKHTDTINSMRDALIANEVNRTMLSMQLENRVYANEWMIIMVLFGITLTFVMLIDGGNSSLMNVVAALLCTGLTMLLIILAKLNTLTHKKAKAIWEPLHELLESDFRRVY